MTRRSIWSIASIVVLAVFVQPSRAAFSLTIQPGDEECFAFRTPKEKSVYITGSFDCIDDDVEAKDLSVSFIHRETGEVIYEAPTGSREGAFKLRDNVKQNTVYELCFQNNESNDDEDNEFEVGFSVHISSSPRTLPDGEIGPDSLRALKLVEKATAIQEDWTEMMDHYEFVQNREAVHQAMNDVILNRLSRWTYIEALVVIGMATGQVMYWRKFFETKRYL